MCPHLKGVTNWGGIIDGLTLRQTMGWRNIWRHLAWLNCTAAKWPVTKCHVGHIDTCVYSQGGWTHKLTRYGSPDIRAQQDAPQNWIFLPFKILWRIFQIHTARFPGQEKRDLVYLFKFTSCKIYSNFVHFILVGRICKPRSFTSTVLYCSPILF